MFSLKVVGLTQLIKKVASIPKQAVYAQSVALNETAKKVQAKEVEELKQSFTTRSEWYKPGKRFGINIQFASKTRLRAVVFSRAKWLHDFEEGGVRTKDKGVFNPQYVPAAKIAQVRGRKVPRNLSITQLKGNPRPMGAFKMGEDWWRRTGKNSIEPVQFEFDRAVIRARYPFSKIGKEVVSNVYDKEFTAAFEKALLTAR